MNYLTQSVLSEDLSPILLGYSSQTDEIAKLLFRRYRIISHVFCEHVPFFRRFSPVMKLHLFQHMVSDELVVTALEEFSESVRNPDVILYLVPTTRRYARLILTYKERLESRFVIAGTDDLRFLLGKSQPESVIDP